MTAEIALAVLATAWCLMTHDVAAQTEGSQDALVRDLMSGNRERVSRAVGSLPLVWPSEGDGRIRFSEDYEVTTELVEAMIAALDHEFGGLSRQATTTGSFIWRSAGPSSRPATP